MAETWNQIIEDALVELGVLADGEDPEAGQLRRALRRLQWMLDQWSAEGLLIPSITHHPFTMGNPAKQVITISADAGDSPDIHTEPPTEIEALTYRPVGATDGRPLRETSYIVYAEYESSVSTLPNQFYYEKSHPVARIYFDAVPLPGDRFKVSGYAPLVPAAIVGTDEHGLPREYPRGVMLNLAVELSSGFGVKQGLAPATVKLAMDAKNNIQGRNIGEMVMRLDTAVVRHSGNALYRAGVSWR